MHACVCVPVCTHRPQVFAENEMICTAGEEADSMYVMLAGSAVAEPIDNHGTKKERKRRLSITGKSSSSTAVGGSPHHNSRPGETKRRGSISNGWNKLKGTSSSSSQQFLDT